LPVSLIYLQVQVSPAIAEHFNLLAGSVLFMAFITAVLAKVGTWADLCAGDTGQTQGTPPHHGTGTDIYPVAALMPAGHLAPEACVQCT
jgi:hypothetical protein